MLLAEKYAPQKVDEVLGNTELKRQLKRWALNWCRGEKGKPILLSGSTGAGKTALAYALARELDMELIQMNASDFRSRERVEKVLHGASLASTLSGRHKLILIDDVDAMAGREDAGGIAAITSLLRSPAHPIMVTITNLWDKRMAPLRFSCEILKMKKAIAPTIAKLLTSIAEKEEIPCPPETIMEIARNANGDVRGAINDLQACSPGSRDRNKDMFERLSSLFRASTYSEARSTAFGDVEHDFLKLWIDENLPAVYSGKELADSFSSLSRADIFDGRIRSRQYWGFLRYSGDLMCAGASLAREDSAPRFTRFSFPAYLKQMSATVASRATFRSLMKKIARRTHTASFHAASYLPIISYMYASDPEGIAAAYDLDEKEEEFLQNLFPRGAKPKAPPKKEKAKKEPAEEAPAQKKQPPETSAPKKPEPPRPSKLSEFF